MKAKSERRRPFVGDQVEDCRDASGLFYILPFQKVFVPLCRFQLDECLRKDTQYHNLCEVENIFINIGGI
jgi:hypothetical protein